MDQPLIRVLLVEDNVADAVFLETILTDAKGNWISLTRVERLGEGLELLAAEEFDVLLLDLSLPDSFGLETVERAQSAAPQIPIVVLTGNDDEATGIETVRSGAQDYLVKGQAEPRLLARSLRHAIERKRAEEDLRHKNERLRLLSETSAKLLLSESPREVVDTICRDVLDTLKLDAFVSHLISEDRRLLNLHAHHGLTPEIVKDFMVIDVGTGVTGKVAEKQTPVVLENLTESNPPYDCLARHHRFASYACHPLLSRGRLLGTLAFGSFTKPAFSPEELVVLRTICDQVAVVMDRADLYAQEQAQRQRAEDLSVEALRRESELKAVFEAMIEPVILYDRQGLPIQVNRAAKALMGLDVSEPREEASARLSLRLPDESFVTTEAMPSTRALRGETVVGERLLFVDADGHRRQILVSASPLFADEAITGAVAVVHDVTERELLLEQLESERARLEAVLRQMPAGVIIAEAPTGRIILSNEQISQIWRLPPELSLDQPNYTELTAFHTDGHLLLPQEWPLSRSMCSGEIIRDEEIRILRGDGTNGIISVSSSPILDREKRIIGAVVIYHDISARKQAEEDLRRAHDGLEARVEERTAELGRANRSLRVLSESSQILVRVSDERDLLRQICETIVEWGGYLHASVDLLDLDHDAWPEPPEIYEHVELPEPEWGEGGESGPAQTAMETGAPCILQNLLSEATQSPALRRLAIEHGSQSICALPLLSGGIILGAMSIYSSEPEAFDHSETNLLTELAGDLTYGLETLRARAERRKAEESLRQTNELLERMFSNIHLLVAYMDRDFNFIRVNRLYAQVDARDPEYFTGKNHFDLYPSSENREIFQRVVETGEPYIVYEKPFEHGGHPEQGISYWDWTLVPLKEPDGRVTGVVLSLLDVTDRVKMAEALWEVERRFRGIFDETFQFIALLEPNGTPIEVNQTMLGFTGHQHGDIVGRPFWLAPFWAGLREDQEKLESAISSAAQGDFVRYEVGLRGADGHVAAVDFSLKPMRDAEGKVNLIIAEGRDVSERKEAQEALAHREEYYRALIDNAQDIIAIIDEKGIIRYGSPSLRTMMGYDPEDLIGRKVTSLVHRDDSAVLNMMLDERADIPDAITRFELRFRHRDGSWRTLAGIGKNLLHNPTVAGIIVNAGDVTERNNAKDMLQDLFKRVVGAHEAERRRLARELHDGVNQILSSAKFRVQSAERKLAGGSATAGEDLKNGRKLLEEAIQEIRRMSHNLRPSVLDDLGLIPAMLSVCDEFRTKTGMDLEFEHSTVPEGLAPNIELTIFRIVQEVLNNVEKHARATKVEIALRREGKMVHLRIRDNGKGFDSSVREVVLRKSGLGLVHMRERAAFVGGVSEVKSAPGQGTEVSVMIPLKSRESEEEG